MDKSPDAFRTISEVADWLGVPTHVLRFWESRFTQVKPVKRAGGRRYYRPADMMLLGGIKRLLHDEGMTIRGVQKMLREEGIRHVSSFSQPIDALEPMRDVTGQDEDADATPMAVDVEQAPADNVVALVPAGGEPPQTDAAAPEEDGASPLVLQDQLEHEADEVESGLEATAEDLSAGDHPTEEHPAEGEPVAEPMPEAAGDAATDGVPAEEAPSEDMQAAQGPAEDADAEETPPDDLSAEEEPIGEAPAEVTATEEIAAQEAWAEDAPAEDAPAEAAADAPSEAALAEEDPAEDDMADDGAEEAPSQEVAPRAASERVPDEDEEPIPVFSFLRRRSADGTPMPIQPDLFAAPAPEAEPEAEPDAPEPEPEPEIVAARAIPATPDVPDTDADDDDPDTPARPGIAARLAAGRLQADPAAIARLVADLRDLSARL